jgi:hypothetical protein
MKAKVSTKSNYRNLNGQWVEIKEFLGTIISCIVFDEILGKHITVDFSLKEITEIKNN